MTISEQIYQQTQMLPKNMQVKALHYVEMLTDRIEYQSKPKKLSDLKGKISFADDYNYKDMRAIS